MSPESSEIVATCLQPRFGCGSSRSTLREFREAGHADAEQPLEAWFAEVSRARWRSMSEAKDRLPGASVVDRERVVLDVGGNKYRLVVKVWFSGQAVRVHWHPPGVRRPGREVAVNARRIVMDVHPHPQ